jgi:hypothetical protein
LFRRESTAHLPRMSTLLSMNFGTNPTFAKYALRNVKRLLGNQMAVEVAQNSIRNYQSPASKGKAGRKTITEEVGFFAVNRRSGRNHPGEIATQSVLKLTCKEKVGKAYTPDELLLAETCMKRLLR